MGAPSIVKEYWINKGLIHSTKWTLRKVNGTKGKILIHGQYNTKKEAVLMGESLLNTQF